MNPATKAAVIEALEQLVVAVQNATPDEGCEQSIACAKAMGEAAIQSLRSVPDAQPVAWAIFTDKGYARMWTTFQPHVQKLADAEGLTVTPLYATPQPAPEPAQDRSEIFPLLNAAPTEAAQAEPAVCGVCGADEPFSGSCGGGRDNPRALCFAGAAQAEPVARLTDNDLERIFEEAGGKWNRDFWQIEDADFHPAMRSLLASSPAQPRPQPLTDEQKRDLVKECGLDWHRGYMPLFDGDDTNRYAVLIEAVQAHHGITAQEPTE